MRVIETRTTRRLALSLGLVVLLTTLDSSVSAEPAATERQLRAAMTFWSTITMTLRKGRPGPGLLAQTRTLCQSEQVYCYEFSAREEIAGQLRPVHWAARIDHRPKWAGLTKYPISEKAKAIHEGPDPETGGEIFYRLRKLKGNREGATVEFRMVRDDVRLTLAVTRIRHESKDRAIRRALARWRFLVRAATHFGVFKEKPITLVPLYGDLRNQQLQPGDVLKFVTRFDTPSELPIRVGARPTALKKGESYRVRIELPRQARKFMRVTGEGVSGHAGTYTLESTEEQVEIILHFDPDALRAGLAAGPTVNVGLIVVRAGGRTKSNAIQVVEWEPVITRFEVIAHVGGRPGEALEGGRTDWGNGRERVELETEFQNVGSLIDTWREFEPMVHTRRNRAWPAGAKANPSNDHPFMADDPVLNAWRRGILRGSEGGSRSGPQEDAAGFYGPQQIGDKPHHGGTFKRGVRLRVNLDLLLAEQAKVEPRMGADDEDDGDFGTPLVFEPAPEFGSAARAENRKNYRFQDFQLSVHEVDPTGADWRLSANRKLADGMARLAAAPDGKISDMIPLPEVEDRGRWVPRLSTFDWVAHRTGIYEIRLAATVIRNGDTPLADRTKKINVAIRVRIVPVEFKSRLMEWSILRVKDGGS